MTDYYFGTDGATDLATCGTSGQRFYIGKLGAGVTAGSGGDFDSTTASDVGNADLVYGYWDIEGPTSPNKPDGDSPAQWGAAQATAGFADTGRQSHSGLGALAA